MNSSKKRPWIRFAALIVVGVVARLFIWALIPADRFASDELGYYNAGITLATKGVQDTYWPPLVGWLIAALRFVLPTAGARSPRLAWVLMDLAAASLLWVIARRVAAHGQVAFKPNGFARLVVLAYLLYIPAISFSQFTTSETPAVLIVLAILVCLTTKRPHHALRFAAAGLLTGLLVLTRSSLACLLLSLPIAIVLTARSDKLKTRALKISIFAVAALLVVGLWLWRNYHHEGDLFLSTNSYYNFSAGNAETYQEDLNLFSPAATPAQMAFRKQYLSGQPITGPNVNETPRQTMQRIKSHKALFLRRALGRLARLFVPRTDELELIGGERRVTIFSWPSITIFLLANAQWALILVCGAAGLLAFGKSQEQFIIWFAAIILGAIPLCLIAISKPRYGFVFEPLLLICAISFLADRARNWRLLSTRSKLTFYLLLFFFAWSWMAWLIFAFTSRW